MELCANNILPQGDGNMITTITTVTTVTTVMAMGLTVALSIAVTIMLILFLVTRQLTSVSSSGPLLRVARFCSVGIIPLLMAFAVIVVVKIITVLPS